MPPKSHAILSASSSHRWLNCNPSARLEQEFEDQETEAAAEGTAALALCEQAVLLLLTLYKMYFHLLYRFLYLPVLAQSHLVFLKKTPLNYKHPKSSVSLPESSYLMALVLHISCVYLYNCCLYFSSDYMFFY